MINGDGNLFALNRHLKEQEMAEKALEGFWQDVYSDTKLIEQLIDDLYRYAKSYEAGGKEYDLTEEVDAYIKSLA